MRRDNELERFWMTQKELYCVANKVKNDVILMWSFLGGDKNYLR